MPGCLWPDLNQADGTVNEGIWLSLDDYGAAVQVAATPVK
jgi:hypothetical protein